jgi:hypothetical protein
MKDKINRLSRIEKQLGLSLNLTFDKDRFHKLLKVVTDSELEQMSINHTKTNKQLYSFINELLIKYSTKIDRVVLTQKDRDISKWIDSISTFELLEYSSGRKPYPEWVLE